MLDLSVYNYDLVSKDPDFIGVSLLAFKSAIIQTFVGLGALNVAFVSLDEIRDLNTDLRDKAKPTDVISIEPKSDSEYIKYPAEIYISPDFIKNALKKEVCTADFVNGKLFLIEICRMLVHGYLHCLGMDHKSQFELGYGLNDVDTILKKSDTELEPMYIKQERILRKLIKTLIK